jgi:CheY-like chemotaxis protein
MNDSESISINPSIQSIFLAEDDLDSCTGFKAALNKIAPNTRITIVTNGDELIELLKHYVPDIVFLDLNMPFKNGFESIRELRENKSYDYLPIVVYSATNNVNSIQIAYGFGANLFFTKPSSPADLELALKEILTMDWRKPELITQHYFHNNQYRPFHISASN